MDVNVAVNEARYFTANNELSGDGRVRYWEEIVEQIQLFDFKKLSLRPLHKDLEHQMTRFVPQQHRHEHKRSGSDRYNNFRHRGGFHRNNNWNNNSYRRY